MPSGRHAHMLAVHADAILPAFSVVIDFTLILRVHAQSPDLSNAATAARRRLRLPLITPRRPSVAVILPTRLTPLCHVRRLSDAIVVRFATLSPLPSAIAPSISSVSSAFTPATVHFQPFFHRRCHAAITPPSLITCPMFRSSAADVVTFFFFFFIACSLSLFFQFDAYAGAYVVTWLQHMFSAITRLSRAERASLRGSLRGEVARGRW